MRFMVIVKATKDSEAGMMPRTQLLTEMSRFNEELVKAGVLLAGDGLHTKLEGHTCEIFWEQAYGNRRPLC